MPVDKASPQARLEEVERGYQDRIARQTQSINRLLEENKLLKIEISTLRDVLIRMENAMEQKPEIPDLSNEDAADEEKRVTGEEGGADESGHTPATQVVDDDDDVELSDNQSKEVDDKE